MTIIWLGLHAYQIVISSWTLLIALPVILLSFCFILLLSLATESRALLYDISQEILSSSERKIMEAYGRIAFNQIENNGSISWIQSGLWYVTISYNDTDNSKNAYFYTDFKMVKPDGSSMHEHLVKDFKSTHIFIEEGRTALNGVADIYSGNSLDYKEIPIIVEIRNDTVIGLAIAKDKTQQHFASSTSNEMLGVLIERRDQDRLLS